MVTDETFRGYIPIIKRRLRRYRKHPYWEDLLSAVYVAVYKSLAQLDEERQQHAVDHVLVASYHAACSWFKSPENPTRTRTHGGSPITTTFVSIHAPRRCGEGEVRLSLVEPDFAPGLVHQLWCEHVRDCSRTAIDKDQWDALWAWCRDMLNEEAESNLGCSVNCAAVRATRAKKRLRNQLVKSEL